MHQLKSLIINYKFIHTQYKDNNWECCQFQLRSHRKSNVEVLHHWKCSIIAWLQSIHEHLLTVCKLSIQDNNCHYLPHWCTKCTFPGTCLLHKVDKVTMRTARKGFVHGCASIILMQRARNQWYSRKQTHITNSHDLYEITIEEWQNNMYMLPNNNLRQCLHVPGLNLYPCPYNKGNLLNYKSLDSFLLFQKGWHG